ncbi:MULTISPECIES: hypothetical protein [Burkholderia]|nr:MULTISPECIES: hypothetical protein [Burkholderia]MCA7889463.1 hypothetical protein [Burkholderia contaminans]
MTDANESGALQPMEVARQPPLWLATIRTLLGLAALALAGLSGYSAGYCGQLGDALLWTVYLAGSAVLIAFIDYPHDILIGLVACIAVAAIARRLQWFRVTWIEFLVALTVVFFAASIVMRLMGSHGACSVL